MFLSFKIPGAEKTVFRDTGATAMKNKGLELARFLLQHLSTAALAKSLNFCFSIWTVELMLSVGLLHSLEARATVMVHWLKVPLGTCVTALDCLESSPRYSALVVELPAKMPSR